MGDASELVAVLDRLTSLHLLRQDGASALQAAEQASALAAELGDVLARGLAALALAEAQLFVGDGRRAQEAADEAAPLLRQAKDKVRLLRAMRVSEAAKEILKRPAGAAVEPQRRYAPPRTAAAAAAPASKPAVAAGVPVAPLPGKPPQSSELDFTELARQIQASIAAMQTKQVGQTSAAAAHAKAGGGR
uniref:Uncharacterized protein n=1 Tax=Alexandrium catenella TaxID=2925 RepID=A0A7S1WF47_ALECA